MSAAAAAVALFALPLAASAGPNPEWTLIAPAPKPAAAAALRAPAVKRAVGSAPAVPVANLTGSTRATASLTPVVPHFVVPNSPVVGVEGQLNVGKSHVYVPYYGDVASGANPTITGVAGLGFGSKTFNVSVVNRALGTDVPSLLSSMKLKSPALTLSIRF